VRTTLVGLASLGLVIAVALPIGEALADDAARGRTLFQLCTQCHGRDGGGNQEALAPAIAGLPQWYVEAQLTKFRTRVRGSHPDDIAGLRMAPMSRMLASEEDVHAVAAYVASLPAARPEPVLVGGDPQKGQVLYAVCMTCHGPQGQGDEKQGAPPHSHASDWYLLTQLQKFKAGIRGANPADVRGAQMRAMSMTLPDEQAMLDVIAYITTLPE